MNDWPPAHTSIYSGGGGAASWSSNALGSVTTVSVMVTAPPPKNPVTITEQDGVLVATWPTFTLRFLFSDGSTLDVLTDRDDSWLREAILAHTKKERIEGSVRLTTTANGPNVPPPTTPKKRTVRRQPSATDPAL